MTSQKSPEFYLEYFRENYAKVLKRQTVPLAYHRQSYNAVADSGLHRHEDHYALYVVHSGHGTHQINGHPYGIARGDIYLAPPGSEHAYRECKNLEVDVFVFQIDLFEEPEVNALRALPGFRNLFVIGDEEEWSRHRLHLAPAQWQEIDNQVQTIRRELASASGEHATPEAAFLTRYLFFRLLVELARLWSQNPAHQIASNAYHQTELADVLQFCEAHYDESLSVPQLAARMFLSPGRFSEIFKKEMGTPPGDYLRRLRLNKAQELLRAEKLSITQIAFQCGFNDAAQFSRAFHATFDITPSDYRKEFKR